MWSLSLNTFSFLIFIFVFMFILSFFFFCQSGCDQPPLIYLIDFLRIFQQIDGVDKFVIYFILYKQLQTYEIL
jgi:hypothetical protein